MTEHPTVLVVLGTRPELIKMAGTIHALRRHERVATRVIFTGQHVELMSDAAKSLEVEPDDWLAPMPRGRNLTDLLGHIVAELGRLIAGSRPACVVVQGDTASALGGALVSELMAIPLVHVEAGVRSHLRDDPFPEETVRRMISPISELHLCFTDASKANLLQEGHAANRVHVVPHPLVDRVADLHLGQPIPGPPIVLVTLHRRERRSRRTSSFIEMVNRAGTNGSIEWQFIWHPTLDDRVALRRELEDLGVSVSDPLDPVSFLELLARTSAVVTDSAGVSEEAQLLGKPLVIFRTSAEPRIDVGALDLTCVTESVEVATEFLERHAFAGEQGREPRQSVSAGTVIAQHVEDFALSDHEERQ